MKRSDNVVEDQCTSGLEFLWLELTRRCNLSCLHCYADASPARNLLGKMTTAAWKTLIAEFAASGGKDLQFIGGEPMLHPDLLTLVDCAVSHGLRTEIFTNGTVVVPEVLDHLAKLDVFVATSFYSHDSDTHDAMTLCRGSHEKTSRFIAEAVARNMSIRVSVIVGDVNRSTADETCDHLKELGVEYVRTDNIRGIGRGADGKHVQDEYAELCGSCGDRKLVVDSDGQVFPCIMSKFAPIGHSTDGLSNLLASKAMSEFKGRMHASHSESGVLSSRSHADCHPDCCPAGMCVPDNCTIGMSPECRPDCCPRGIAPTCRRLERH